MAGALSYIDLTTLVSVFHSGLRGELDSSIGYYPHTDSERRTFVYSNARSLVSAMTVISKQICLSRQTSHFAIRITEGRDNYCISFLFETEIEAPVYGEADIPANAPSLEMSKEALEYVIRQEYENGFEIYLTRRKKFSSFDFIFGKTERNIDNAHSEMHETDYGYVSEEFFRAIEMF